MAKTIKLSNVSLEMLVSSKPYKDPKNIAIQYALGEGISILNYSVESEGLNLSKAIDFKDPTQTINLSLKGDKGCITIVFNLSDSTQKTVKLFAINATKGVYFSQRSYDQAERISLQGELTETNYVTEMMRRQGIDISPVKKTRKLPLRGSTTCSVYKLEVLWQDSEGKTHPVRRLKIGIVNSSGYKTGYTDNNGKFEFSATSEAIKSTTYIIYSATDCINVSETLNGESYAYGVGYPSNTKSYKYIIPSSFANSKYIDEAIHAIQISQALTFGYDYVQEMSKNTFKQKVIQVRYPNEYDSSNQTSYYSQSNNGLHIYETAYLCWDILLHEFGHLLQNEYGIADSPGEKHDIDADLIAMRGNKDKGIRLAWGEAWPTTFGIMVTQYYGLNDYPRVADTFYHANNGRLNPTNYWTRDMETNRSNPLGEGCELDVFCLLYDMYDNGYEAGADSMSMSHETFWNLVTGSKAKTLRDFLNYVRSYGYNTDSLAQILSAHGIAGKILSLDDRKLNIQVGGNPRCDNSRQNEAIVYYANYSTWDYFKDVTTINLSFKNRVNNMTSVNLPLKEIYQDPGAKMRCCLGTWQTSSPCTGLYFSPWVTLEKKRFLSSAYFFPTDDFSFLTKRTKKWQSKSVQINNRTFSVEGLNVLYCDPYVLMNIPGTNGDSSVSILSEAPIYGFKFSVFVDIPKGGFSDAIIGANVFLSVVGITRDDRILQLSSQSLLGHSMRVRVSDIVKHLNFKSFDNKGNYLKRITINVSTNYHNNTLANKVKVKLGNILLSSSPTMPDFF